MFICGWLIIDSHPCCVWEKRFSEYAAVIKLIRAIGTIAHREYEIIEVINMISLKRLSEGGPAMLQTRIRNHHIDRLGTVVNMPLVRKDLRV